MTTPHTCPKCGAQLPADAPEGLCPACLMIGGLPSDAATLKMTPSRKPGGNAEPVITPTPEELAPYFPQLEILELLGRGGMGMVYKARQKNLNRLVALKILPVEPGADEHFAERFQREAQALAKLNHPNIVSVFDFGQADVPGSQQSALNSQPLYYFLMEFVDGANLRTLIRSGEMKPEAALALIPAFCDALQYAHDEGVVHRDIKPENVLVDKKGRVKIADFGLAKLLGHDSTDHTLTRTGMSLGTPRYMAPEQFDKPETVDHRADIYSLGVVFYEMLTGEVPMGRFPLPSQKVRVDVRFDEIVLHALEKEPSLRYQQASQIKTDVENVTGVPSPGAAAAQPEPPAAPDTIHLDEAKPEAVTPLPRRFWWRAFGMLMLGWLVVGALWNLRFPGCLLGALVLSGITMEIAFRHVSRKSRWAREWREAAAFQRVFFTCGYVALGVVPFMMLLGAMHAKWETSSLHWNFSAKSPEEFEAAHKGREYLLIRSLDAFKTDLPTTELTSAGFSWHSGIHTLGEGGPFLGYYGPFGILVDAFAGLVILLLFFQQVVGAERASVWRLALDGWGPAAHFTFTVLASAVCAYGILTTVFIYRNMPAHRFHNNDFSMSVKVVNASAKQVEFALNKWAVENDYAIGDEHSWNLTTVPRGQNVAQTAIFNAWKPSPFDRWHMTWTGMRHVSPHVAAEMTGTEKPPQSVITLSAKMNLLDTGDEAQVKRVMKSMEEAVSQAAKMDVNKPLDEQITIAHDDSAAATGISGWWLFTGVIGLSVAWTAFRYGRSNKGIQSLSQNERQQGANALAATSEPQLSKLAVWGAILAALGLSIFITVVGVTLIQMLGGKFQGVTPLHLGVAFGGLVCILVSTILGAIAIAQIKRSGGQLYGLRLAIAGALVFPLLLLAVAAFFGTTLAWSALRLDPPNTAHAPVPEILVALVVCFFAGRAAWRKIAGVAPAPGVKTTDPFHFEAQWLSRPHGVQRFMSIVLGAVLVLSLLCFFSFRIQATTTADHSGVIRTLYDTTVGLGDPWLFLFHHQTGTRGGMESGLNWLAGSALFGCAAWCAGAAFTRLTREQKRRRILADPSTDTPRQKFFWSAVAGVGLFIAGVVSVVVHDVRKEGDGGLLADAVHEVHPDFTRPGIASIALKKAIADELKLTPEQLEKIDRSLNRHYLEFLKLESEHSTYRVEQRHVIKTIKPFPDRSFALAQKLATELRGIAGREIIPEPERNAVWKLRLFRHAGEFNVRAELWEKNSKFHREETWERDGKKITGGKSGDSLNDMNLAFGHYIVDWVAMQDNIHEPAPDDASHSFTFGWDTMQFFINEVRNGEIARLIAADPKAVIKSGNPHAALVTRAGESVGRSCAEIQLDLHGIPFAKNATPEDLVKKLEELLGGCQSHEIGPGRE